MKPIEHGWEVEWCETLKHEADGSMDPDSAEYSTNDFETKEQAVAFAKQMLPRDKFGGVRVTEFKREPDEYVPLIINKEYIGDSMFVED